MPPITIKQVTENSFTYELNGITFCCQHVEGNTNTITFDITGPNKRIAYFNIRDINADFSHFISTMPPETTISPNAKGWPAVAWAVACLIAGIVDYYCDKKIQNGVAECTKQHLCSVVGVCEVRCEKCN
jgi:hypothetical protein